MSDTTQVRSPLAAFLSAAREWNAAELPGMQLSELSFRDAIILRGEAADSEFQNAIRQHLGVAVPVSSNTFVEAHGYTLLWLGPNEWLIVGLTATKGKLAASLCIALHGVQSAVVDVSHNNTILRVSGPRTIDVLRKGCSFDLHPSSFGVGRCAQTLMGKAAIIIRWVDTAPTIDLIVRRSYAEYLALWLADAAEEYGVAIRKSNFAERFESSRVQTQQT